MNKTDIENKRCFFKKWHAGHGNMCPGCGGSDLYYTCSRLHGEKEDHFGWVVGAECHVDCPDYFPKHKQPKCPICMDLLYFDQIVGWNCPKCNVIIKIIHDCWAKEIHPAAKFSTK